MDLTLTRARAARLLRGPLRGVALGASLKVAPGRASVVWKPEEEALAAVFVDAPGQAALRVDAAPLRLFATRKRRGVEVLARHECRFGDCGNAGLRPRHRIDLALEAVPFAPQRRRFQSLESRGRGAVGVVVHHQRERDDAARARIVSLFRRHLYAPRRRRVSVGNRASERALLGPLRPRESKERRRRGRTLLRREIEDCLQS
mmetsp:Transcript_507/g.1708  ORF Transcript_507/g.1708 Transcript_507/m.1708 type:complete len:203 (-) Transcript_507:1022-1630(-)